MLRIERLGTITGHGNWASLEPLVIAPPSPYCEVCVIVPVRDEAENLTATLDALARQIDLEGRLFDRERYEIIVLANNCSDDSAAIARCFAKQHPTLTLHVVEITLPSAEAYVGRARRILMDEAYRRLTTLDHGRGVIASTDGDTRVAPTWLAATLHEIREGADAVGGRILTDRAGRAALDDYARLCHLREVGYRYLVAELETYLDPDPYDCWPRHYQHFGASLAVTAQMYGRVGGLPAVRSPEDVAFYQALLRVDARFRHSPAVRVVTSARQVGRTKNGLANQLSEWEVMGRKHQPFLVESAAAIEGRLRARRRLRVLWRQSQLGHQPFQSLIGIYNQQEISPLGRETGRKCCLTSSPLQTIDTITHSTTQGVVDSNENRYNIALLADELGVATEWLTDELKQPQTFGLLLERTIAKQEGNTWSEQSPRAEIEQAIRDLRDRLNRLRCARKRPLDPLEEVEPILLLPSAPQMPQVRTRLLDERVVNLIAT